MSLDSLARQLDPEAFDPEFNAFKAAPRRAAAYSKAQAIYEERLQAQNKHGERVVARQKQNGVT